MSRNLKDASLSKGGALPNAANTVNGNVIDLGQTTPYPVTGEVIVQLTSTAATGAANKNINIRLQHSDESNANFVNIPELANPVLRVTDNNGGGYPAGVANVTLPPGTKRYIRAVALGEASGGDASAGTFAATLLF
jgi:hypothetical protein